MSSGDLEIPLILQFNCSKSINFFKLKRFVNELHDYEFSGEVKIEENEDEEEIPTIVIDKDQDILDEHTEGKNGRCF